jgi:heterodisulfide reductase subunit B
MLTQTEKAGGHTTTLCAICYHVLKRTQVFLDRNPEALERINWFTEEAYGGQARISHFLELLRDEMGWGELSKRVRRPLTGLMVAPYYGCLLLRPKNEIGLDDPDEPTILHDCLAAMGCEVIDFPFEVECCGSYLAVSQPELPESLSQEIVASARRNGALAIVTACPLCQFNLDHAQRGAGTGGILSGNEVPVLYFTQLMAVALGLDAALWGMDAHYVDPIPLFATIHPTN